ncbi:MAG: beta-lactamase family protein [Pirellula sp.]|jgi:CubicO group peptidase (beta-lactamase class C family)|nr:beta-lactamase family protein [Pirellula sp.]
MPLLNRRTVAKQLVLAGIASRCTLSGDHSVSSLFASDNSLVPHIPSVREAMEGFVKAKEIPGAVTLVASSEKLLHLDASGYSDLGSGKALQTSDIFWIASMTKPMTGVCVMMLVEAGKLRLDAPISEYLPEMKNLALNDGTPARITLKHLLTHTSGMAELPAGEAYSSKNLKEAAARYAKVKVLFEPGSKWQYSQTSINTAACIVEAVSGKPFDVFLEEKICKPLGMKDTSFYLSESQVQRLAKSYRRTEQGELVEAAIGLLGGKKPTDRDRMPAANGGLFSTAEDYARFARMLLRKGELEGVRILSPESVATFSAPSAGDVVTGFTPGNTWGIGCCIVREPQGVSKDLSPGSYGHGGAYGTQAWIDPVKDRCFVLMTQRANFPNSDASDVRKAFQEKAAQAL